MCLASMATKATTAVRTDVADALAGEQAFKSVVPLPNMSALVPSAPSEHVHLLFSYRNREPALMQFRVAKSRSFRKLLENLTIVAENGDKAKKLVYQCGLRLNRKV